MQPGQARFWHNVFITKQHYGPVHLALAHHRHREAHWYVLSDLPTSPETFDEYGLRFDIKKVQLHPSTAVVGANHRSSGRLWTEMHHDYDRRPDDQQVNRRLTL